MVLIGIGAVYAGTDYHLGSLSHMGPGFFPAAIGSLLALVGLMIAASARSRGAETVSEKAVPVEGGHGHAFPDLRGGACILLGILAFLLLGEWGGLLPATFAIVFISALGDRTNTIKQALLLSASMCAIAIVVFWWALQLQLPLFRWG
ncbi:tripartite tricarboxylate transporter TctB [Bordetella genomosp. 1]|uniref:Tripartite tricarboxylate transporter TctB n=1 Tax=Bordetella genomosp. 1 TaxID=1395607 RepID=A0A261SUW3_9BORD|nr:tripartite tricarboxylate transporter TctB family protein [Bordetella genomosp. 1]MDQ8032246.1 tripartite tricarboxylate transporter TctB family protein [Bordetella sp.]OZI40881.1 tripartite tricarboxylate transporter TctB [Bordetella genomosp. 1]OZI69073.1 tripartite tricarboxylate transporter TctB [Bordetella genomosp. 1]